MRIVKEFCCCAIPLLNAGTYVTLVEQLVVAITAGILAFVAPAIVGASVPSFVPTVFGILCFVAAGIQLFGFWGVFRESTVAFRRYTTLHSMITLGIFIFSAVFIGISASKHNTAQAKCVTDFFPADSSTTATALTGSDSEGKLLCNIFTWVGVGIMGGLWLVLGLFHAYLFLVISGYGSSQRDDHRQYYSLYSLNSYPGQGAGPHSTFLPASEAIGMRNMGAHDDAWDTRDSMDTVGFEKQQYAANQAQYPAQQGYPQPQRQPSGGTVYPGPAKTMDPQPTPYQTSYNTAYEDPYYNNNPAVMNMGRPDAATMHPAEGSFHRKTPRMTPEPPQAQQYYSQQPYYGR